jgi:hypothetical protein
MRRGFFPNKGIVLPRSSLSLFHQPGGDCVFESAPGAIIGDRLLIDEAESLV